MDCSDYQQLLPIGGFASEYFIGEGQGQGQEDERALHLLYLAGCKRARCYYLAPPQVHRMCVNMPLPANCPAAPVPPPCLPPQAPRPS